MVSVRPIALATVCICLSVSGCSGDEKPAAAATTSSSTSPSISPTVGPSTTPERFPPAPKARPGPVGQRAFARYVIGAWGYALRTNDSGPLLSLSPAKQPCGGCASLARELTKRDKQGWYVDFAGADVSRLTLASKAGLTIANATVDIPESNAFNDDGTYRSTNPAHPRSGFQVRMKLVKKKYQLVSFTLV